MLMRSPAYVSFMTGVAHARNVPRPDRRAKFLEYRRMPAGQRHRPAAERHAATHRPNNPHLMSRVTRCGDVTRFVTQLSQETARDGDLRPSIQDRRSLAIH